MEEIQIKNKDVIKLLNDYSNWFERYDKNLIKSQEICLS